MSKLQDLFSERAIAYAKYSDEILQVLSVNVVPAVLEMLDLSDSELERLTWHSVRVVEDHVLLVGAIAYTEGDIIKDDETTVTLTGELAMIMSKLVRVAIPMHLADGATQNVIVDHLKESERQLKKEYEEAYGHDPEMLDAALENVVTGELGWSGMDADFITDVIQSASDFKIEDLTEEQQQALMMTHLAQNKGNKPN